jgi:hypothetical protein
MGENIQVMSIMEKETDKEHFITKMEGIIRATGKII